MRVMGRRSFASGGFDSMSASAFPNPSHGQLMRPTEIGSAASTASAMLAESNAGVWIMGTSRCAASATSDP